MMMAPQQQGQALYPFTTPTGIVRNRWYVAAFAHEITRQPMERTLLGKPVAMYRREDGRPVAMYGLCPHRYYPLALGKLRGDALVCGYHGFVFDADGKCIDVPSQGTGTGFCQPTYPIVERGPLCWIWLGDGDKADPALIPPYADMGLDQPGWRTSSFTYFSMRGRAQLLIDNLLDLSHLPYVHHHIPGGEHLIRLPMHDQERAGIFTVIRQGKVPWGPFQQLVYGPQAQYDGVADVDNVTAFYGPEMIRTGLGIYTRVDGHAEVPPALGRFFIHHAITPETETTTHYFGFATRDFRLDSAELDDFWQESDSTIRQQDIAAIEAVELRLESAAAAQRELLVKADGPAVKVRRRVQAMLDAEAGQ